MHEEYYSTHFEFPEPMCFASVLTRPPEYRTDFTHVGDHINIVTSGSLKISIGGRTQMLGVGCAVFLPHGLRHHVESPTGYSQIGLELVPAVPDPRGVSALLAETFEGQPQTVSLTVTHEKYLTFKQLMLEEGTLVRLRLINLAEGLLLECLAGKRQRTEPFREQLRQVLNGVDMSSLNVGVLAERLHYSKGHTDRLFKQNFGVTATEYIAGLRLRTVMALLRETDLSLAEIAANNGFYDASHLICFFKKHCGMTPHAFRNRQNGQSAQ